ncbi:MAG: bifunctional oligoribonuclease/PAP phosphatase NrnA [Clostridium sp.]|nr:bifunctional oligoribonuclease/PAP phosphatase NrnA [Acetatifactor muris]MCM1527935.1 bifunctional oligoribonuclease/PAP phosphatase NrnA [Bacteroides sp.]MCM1564129.1 bifunctional oligoribonuclease/PAP phosphatase NrnA [Clostridium sp.]
MNLLQETAGAERIAIGGHVRPDGDCVGACLSVWQYLRAKLPKARVQVFLEQPQEIFRGLTGCDAIVTDFPEEDPFDIFIALDCNEERLGEAVKYFRQAKKTINIDHHVSNPGCGDVNLVRPEIGSTCEVLYDLIGEENLDRNLAETLYVGIIHDTGVFQYSNTTPETMEKGARLIGYGFDFPRLIEESFYQRTYVQSQIMGRALMESIRFLDGQCIVSAVTRKMMHFYNVGPKDLDGIVNQLRNIRGIHCAIFMYESDVQEYKISMRSDERVDVSKVAVYFGGGGHVRAAGCTMKGSFHDCINNLSLHIERQLKEYDERAKCTTES